MRADDFLPIPARLKTYAVKLKIKQSGYTTMLDTTIQARNPQQARQILHRQYNDRNVIVGQPRELGKS